MGRFGNNKRQIKCFDNVYDSIVEASKSTGVPASTISSQLLKRSGNWMYVEYPDLQNETWMWHPYLNIQVSDLGRIKRKNGVPTYGTKRKDGYCYFHHFQTKKNYSVHRLVAETWLGCDDENVVHHLDGDKSKNIIENLIWVSQRENVRFSI